MELKASGILHHQREVVMVRRVFDYPIIGFRGYIGSI